MILIADSGSTKTEWCLSTQGRIKQRILTAGMNPFFQTEEDIVAEIKKNLYPQIQDETIDTIYFYGAGCAFPDKNDLVEKAIQTNFPDASIFIHSDLLGAARSLCQHSKGIACILGTGSNSCLYDGENILDHVSPLGFILGDEASGAVLGRQFVGDCLKRQIPKSLQNAFLDYYKLTPAMIMEQVYKQPFPNRFLAQFTRFMAEHLDEPCIKVLIYDQMRIFMQRNVMNYKEHEDILIHCTGSIAWHFKDILKGAAQSLDLHLGTITQAPMEGLLAYHKNEH